MSGAGGVGGTSEVSEASEASEALLILNSDEIGREIAQLIHAHEEICEAMVHARKESVEVSRVDSERVIASFIQEMEAIEAALGAPNLVDGIPALKQHLLTDGKGGRGGGGGGGKGSGVWR